MRILWALVLALVLGLQWGCTAADKAQMDEAMKELRGDNIQMGYYRKAMVDEPARLRASD